MLISEAIQLQTGALSLELATLVEELKGRTGRNGG